MTLELGFEAYVEIQEISKCRTWRKEVGDIFQAEGTEWAKTWRCEKAISFLRTGNAGDRVHVENRKSRKERQGPDHEGLGNLC